MAQGHRPDRVGEAIRHELSELLTRGAVHDPGVGFITLTRVKVSPDLQIARVFYTSMGDDSARDVEGPRGGYAVLPPAPWRPASPASRAGAGVPLRRIDRQPGSHRADTPGPPSRRGATGRYRETR